MGTNLKLPIATTHCMVGALMGLAVCQRFKVVQDVYPIAGEEQMSLNFKLLTKIVAFWVLTIPITFVFAFLLAQII